LIAMAVIALVANVTSMMAGYHHRNHHQAI
jgi:hypothetical protein